MVLLRAGRVRREFAEAEFRRGTERGRVGLDEDAFTGDGRGELDAQVGLARNEMVRAEREIGAELRKLRHELDRSVPAMQQEATPRQFGDAQDIHQRPDRLDGVDGQRAVEFDGQRELRPEGRLLGDGIEVLHPTVEAHLADAGGRVREQDGAEFRLPAFRCRGDVPRMQAERDAVARIAAREGGHVRPVRGRAAVDHRLADAIRPGLLDRRIRDFGELVVAMGVAEFHRSVRG